jgi:hypothetical protein
MRWQKTAVIDESGSQIYMTSSQGAVRVHVRWAMKAISISAIVVCPILAYVFWQQGHIVVSLGLMLYVLLA